MGLGYQCPSLGVNDYCSSNPMEYNEDGFKKLVIEVVNLFTFYVQAHYQMFGSILDNNKLYALNAQRCLIFNLPYTNWNFLLAWYYVFKTFGLNGPIETVLDKVYPIVCTCNYEANQFAQFFGANDWTNEVMSDCDSDLYI